MINIVVITFHDKQRPSLTYKVRLTDRSFEDWWSKVGLFGDHDGEPNTAVCAGVGEGIRVAELSLDAVSFAELMLSAEEAVDVPMTAGPGRRPQAVLQATTYQERKNGTRVY